MEGKRVLVTGGCGYIGSHTHWRLVEAGYSVVVLDNLYSGHRWALHPRAELIEGDAGDIHKVRSILRDKRIDAVIHFAGHIVVPESVHNPLKYYKNNTCVSRNLISASLAEGVRYFIFSSSAAVYGMPETLPVSELASTAPISPYGSSKLMTEWMLRDVAASTSASTRPFRYVALRYFNVAGARSDGHLGQATPEATHLIKVACQAACGLRAQVNVFGNDYPTEDGTCVRDYIHVEDLAAAHLDALAYLRNGGGSQALNCGYGRGFSVRDVICMVKRVSGVDFIVRDDAPRPGDPPILVADASQVRIVLGWNPGMDDLETICRSAYQWERKWMERKNDNRLVARTP